MRGPCGSVRLPDGVPASCWPSPGRGGGPGGAGGRCAAKATTADGEGPERLSLGPELGFLLQSREAVPGEVHEVSGDDVTGVSSNDVIAGVVDRHLLRDALLRVQRSERSIITTMILI